MQQAEIGLIGLGVMGSNLALNIAEKGNRIAGARKSHELAMGRTGIGVKYAGASGRRIPLTLLSPARGIGVHLSAACLKYGPVLGSRTGILPVCQ